MSPPTPRADGTRMSRLGGGLVTGFVETFVMATASLVVCILAGTLVPGRSRAPESLRLDSQLATNPE